MKAPRGVVTAQALGAWDGLVFSDDEGGGRKELRRRVGHHEWEPAAALRRFAAFGHGGHGTTTTTTTCRCDVKRPECQWPSGRRFHWRQRAPRID